MREYEACFVINPKVDEAGIEREIETFSETVTSSKGEMVGVHKWGRRKLAYPVRKIRDGFYVVARFNAEADVLKEVDRRFKLNEQILRHLVVRSLGDEFPPDLRAREPRRGVRGEGGPGRGRRRDEFGAASPDFAGDDEPDDSEDADVDSAETRGPAAASAAGPSGARTVSPSEGEAASTEEETE